MCQSWHVCETDSFAKQVNAELPAHGWSIVRGSASDPGDAWVVPAFMKLAALGRLGSARR
jgi:hypothetical protein